MQPVGNIELASDFQVIYEQKPKGISFSKRQITIGLCIIVIISMIVREVGIYFHEPVLLTTHGYQMTSEVLLTYPVALGDDRILFSKADPPGSALWIMDYRKPWQQKQIYQDDVPLFPSSASQDSAKLALTIQARSHKIAILSPVSRDASAKNAKLKVVTEGGVFSEWPSLSPTGEKIVYQQAKSKRVDPDLQILDTSDLSIPVLTGRPGQYPQWSPKRDEIVFESSEGGSPGTSNIWRWDLSVNNYKNLTHVMSLDQAYLTPSFSPDGEQILFHKRGGGLWIMRRDGSDARQILKADYATMFARMTPDEKSVIVCQSNGSDTGNLWVYFFIPRWETVPPLSKFSHRKPTPRWIKELPVNAKCGDDNIDATVYINREKYDKTPTTVYDLLSDAVIQLEDNNQKQVEFKVEDLREYHLSYDFCE